MTVAVLGFIGVVVGALLTGVVAYVVERKKHRNRARVAARLLALEIRVARKRILSAAAARSWWAGELPTAARSEQLSDLAFGLDLSNAELRKIDGAYVIIESWNLERDASGSKALTETQREELAVDAGELEKVIKWLTEELRQPLPAGEGRIARWLSSRRGIAARWLSRLVRWQGTRNGRIARSLTLLFLLAAVVAFELGVPREDLDSTTVAAAVQSQLGDRVFVDCNPRGDGWACMVHHLSAPRGECLIGAASTSASSLIGARAVPIVRLAATPCHDVAPPTPEDVSKDPANEHLVMTPAQYERQQARLDTSAEIPRECLFEKIVDAVAR